MDLLNFALRMWPNWLMGIYMIYATIKSDNKDLVRVESSPIRNWVEILTFATIFRFLAFFTMKLTGTGLDAIREHLMPIFQIPWQLTLTVFWEDACHTLPLALLQRFLPNKLWAKALNFVALLLVMLSFGLGHTYQGIGAACLISLYIPISLKLGKKYGFGTMMICHTLYDLSTALLVQWVMRP